MLAILLNYTVDFSQHLLKYKAVQPTLQTVMDLWTDLVEVVKLLGLDLTK